MEHYDFSIMRELRKAKGLTIADIAKASGISAAVISRIERNQAHPELHTLSSLGGVFGIKAADLLGLAEAGAPRTVTAQQYNSGGFQFQHVTFHNTQCFVGVALRGEVMVRRAVPQNEHEFCWVRSGRIEIRIGNEPHFLEEGEAIQLDTVLKHTYRAVTDCKIIIFYVRDRGAVSREKGLVWKEKRGK
ncbi:helix-turn-helix domain-containing protein [Fibrobacterota bacterium]